MATQDENKAQLIGHSICMLLWPSFTNIAVKICLQKARGYVNKPACGYVNKAKPNSADSPSTQRDLLPL